MNKFAIIFLCGYATAALNIPHTCNIPVVPHGAAELIPQGIGVEVYTLMNVGTAREAKIRNEFGQSIKIDLSCSLKPTATTYNKKEARAISSGRVTVELKADEEWTARCGKKDERLGLNFLGGSDAWGIHEVRAWPIEPLPPRASPKKDDPTFLGSAKALARSDGMCQELELTVVKADHGMIGIKACMGDNGGGFGCLKDKHVEM